MNNQRDSVKDAINEVLAKGINLNEISPEIADAVFDALGITKDEQDSTGGYFMHHAGKKKYAEYIIIPLTEQIKEALSWEEAGQAIWKCITEARKAEPDILRVCKKRSNCPENLICEGEDKIFIDDCPSFIDERPVT